MCLHWEVAPRHTTVSAIAARAGVERLTVHRHFHDEAECSPPAPIATGNSIRPTDASAWAKERDRHLGHFGSITVSPLTGAKCFWLKLATRLPLSNAVAATITS